MSTDIDLTKLAASSTALQRLEFPTLLRPRISGAAPPTRALVNWAVRLYCFSILSHYREMLESFLLLKNANKTPGSILIGRCLFEMGAHAYYVDKHISERLSADDIQATWKLLVEINMGNRYLREIRERRGTPFMIIVPRDIAKVIRTFDEYGNNHRSVESYSFLSEFSHPNMAAFSYYYWMEETSRGLEVRFTQGHFARPADPTDMVIASLVALVDNVTRLLNITNETSCAAQLVQILRDQLHNT